MDKNDLHQVVKWAPRAAFALILGIATLGGESVRERIWDEITLAFQNSVSLAVMVGCVALYAILWYGTRPKSKLEREGDTFTQNHSGSGDNNINL